MSTYVAEFRGRDPLRPSDFEGPLRCTVPSNRKIIAIQKSSNLRGPLRFDSRTETLDFAREPPLDFEAQTINPQTCNIKPLLMNSGEWFRVEIYTAAAETPDQKAEPEMSRVLGDANWLCHIAGGTCPDKQDYGIPIRFRIPALLDVSVSHEGWAVYVVVISTILNLLLLVVLAKKADLHKLRHVVQICLFSIAVATSITISDYFAGSLMEGRWLIWPFVDHPKPPPVAMILYSIHIIAVGILLWRVAQRTRVGKQRR